MSDHNGGAKGIDDVLVVWVEDQPTVHFAYRILRGHSLVSEREAGLDTYLGILSLLAIRDLAPLFLFVC